MAETAALHRGGGGGVSTQAYNCWALVMGFTRPKLVSRTGDWMTTLTLADETMPETGMVSANVFARPDKKDENSAALRRGILQSLLVAVGDVVRIHRAEISIWDGRLQLR